MASIDRLLPDDELVQLDEADVGRDDLEGLTKDGVREHALPQSLEMLGHRFDARVVRDPGLLPLELRHMSGGGAPLLDERQLVGQVAVRGHDGHEVPEVIEWWSTDEIDALVDDPTGLVARDTADLEIDRVGAPWHQLTTTTRILHGRRGPGAA